MEKRVQIEHHPAFQHVIDGPREFMGQDRERLALAVLFLESGEILLACGIIPQEEDRGFREGPLEIGIANVGACGPVAFAGRFSGVLDQAAVGDKILDAGETREVMDSYNSTRLRILPMPGTVWSR
jgi:hypothetical protein